jgi:hypothetical protein
MDLVGGAEKENIHGEDGKIHVQACNVAKDEAITSEQADIVRDSSFGRKFIDPDHNYRTSKILPSSRVLRSSKRRSHTY